MDQTKLCGTQSLHFQRPAYILSAASVAGKKEAEGPLGKKFDMVDEQDNLFGAKTWEEAESNMQKEACILAIRKSRTETGEDPVSVRGRSSEAGDCHFYGSGGTADSYVRALRGMFNIRRGTGTGSNECVGRVWRLYAGGYIKPFRKCGKGVPFSVGLCQPETFICTLDSDRERGFCSGNGSGKCEDQRDHSGKDRGLRTERFAEYGSMHGSGGC